MVKLKIENFGPIIKGCESDNGWLIIKKNTFLIGNQGSGKSTVAKLFSMLTWLEKALNRKDFDENNISFAKFIEFTEYQKINNYFKKNTFIDYIGDKFRITYDIKNDYPTITKIISGNYDVPKIMYVPAERNFLSTISNAFSIKGLPDNVFTFAEELKEAQKELKGSELDLKISSFSYKYDEETDSSFILGNNHKINLLEASSGLQSYTPLFLVSRNLSNSISNNENISLKNLSVTQTMRMNTEISQLIEQGEDNSSKTINSKEIDEINEIRSRFYSTCFINIVEEPEQNLFPDSQLKMLEMLIEYNNINENNKLLITTHSPYLVNYLSLFTKGFLVEQKANTDILKNELDAVISLKSLINPDDLVVYELDESNGSIKKLDNYKGLPSDENYLNDGLSKTNDMFINLLEIEDKCL